MKYYFRFGNFSTREYYQATVDAESPSSAYAKALNDLERDGCSDYRQKYLGFKYICESASDEDKELFFNDWCVTNK